MVRTRVSFWARKGVELPPEFEHINEKLLEIEEKSEALREEICNWFLDYDD